ncbi:hypothetical protein TUM3794_06990 [Shewanella colwelliana]|uniref:DUF4019 domain-containing protein n=1 Tax=Shewanella colwelliana TaxID=23 RepID=A0ABQ4NVN7_SHECO|nr:hypothetical protein [Shewanella colwelliana]GIU36989.1 hypothetical protein TUM3794_06990 [Shewanella colwelliana]
MKTLFKIVVFGSLSLVAFFIAMIAIAALTSVDKAEVFEPYLTETVPKLVKWEHQTFKDLMTQDAYNTAKPEQWDLYIKKLSTLGALKSFEQAELQNWHSTANIGSASATYATYIVPMAFDTGPAHLTLTLVSSNDKTLIHSIKFSSDILMQ